MYFFLSISNLLNVESSLQPVRQSSPLAHFSFRTMRVPRVTQLPRHILPPVAPETERRCTCGPACPARETGTRNRPWCVFLLISLQIVSLESCEFRRVKRGERISRKSIPVDATICSDPESGSNGFLPGWNCGF